VNRTIQWRIALPYVVLVAAVAVALVAYVTLSVRNELVSTLEEHLIAEAQALSIALQATRGDEDRVEELTRRWAVEMGGRVTVVDADGRVLGDSCGDCDDLTAVGTLPEVRAAIEGRTGLHTRRVDWARDNVVHVAVPAPIDGGTDLIVRIGASLAAVSERVVRLRQTVVLASLLAIVLAVLIALLIAERITRPVRDLTRVAERMAAGDLDARLVPTTDDEVGQLTVAFNDMAARLGEDIADLGEERSRLAAVLEHMADGVLITDRDGRVSLMNPTAGRLLGMPPASALGRSFAQVVRHHALVEVWQRCVDTSAGQNGAIELGHGGPFVQAFVTPLRNGGSPTCLVMLQDLTRVRRLETVRRDFMSNISHELRTPLASLKALVDTLRDGALNDPPAAQRFLDRIETEVDALTQMVQELLELSRIESGQVPLRFSAAGVEDVVRQPVERLMPQATRARLAVAIDLPPNLPPVLVDLERVRQVVTNLVHNAIKFTPPGGAILVTAGRVADGDEIVISVEDTGVGIAADDLTRIFERFYKADRARSGGGTGLGLSIAKHIVRSHGGRIWAESTEGQGSTFHFTLPVADRK
jgi:two-component system phosphate regulon sensor histidine kinase PhoR